MFPHVSTDFIKKRIYSFFIKVVETCGNMLNLVLGPSQLSGNMYGNMYGNMWEHVCKTSMFMKTCMEDAFGRRFF